jgi:curved DNA-binding protein CbpA
MLQDDYDILDLKPGATDDEIRKAYRLKAKLCHPDASKSPEAAFEFIRLKEAFDTVLKSKHPEDTERHRGFAHPRDPYFQQGHGSHAPHAQNNGKPVGGDQDAGNDFLHSKAGYILYLFMHIVFLVTGFIALLGPLYSVITRGFDRYSSFFYSVFNLVAVMAFGVIMIVKISGSFFRFTKKPF